MKNQKKSLIYKFAHDSIYSLIATGILTGVTQLIIYPQLSIFLNDYEFGVILSTMAIVNVIMSSFASQLSYVRLISNQVYRNNKISGDFQLLLLFTVLITTFLFICINTYYLKINRIIFLLLINIITILKNYYSVEFKLEADFKKILFMNVMQSIGILVGFYFFIKFGNWMSIFILGELLALIYIFKYSTLKNEAFRLTEKFSATTKRYIIFIGSALINNSLNYFDKLLIFPTLGAEAVAVFSVATFFGKSLYILIQPITSVIFSYLSSGILTIRIKNYAILNIVLVIGGIIGFLIFNYLSFPITKYFYPTLFNKAASYIFIGNLGTVINILNSFNIIILIKLAPSIWQIRLSIIFGIQYIFGSIWVISSWGLEGFYYLIIIVNILRYLIVMIINFYYLFRKNIFV